MKRLTLLSVVLLVLSAFSLSSIHAQDSANLITLNDASPAIDVVITLPPDTTGTVAISFSGAAVRLTDAAGAVVFSTADSRLHGLELNIAPNSGSHTLTIERLPGTAEALVQVEALPELPIYGFAELVTGLAITPRQEISLPLSADHPGDTVDLTIPGESAGMVTATFPGAGATAQIIDADGVVMVESVGGHVDGMSLLLDPGSYHMTLLGSGLSQSVVAGVRLVSADEVGITVMQTPVVVAANTMPCLAYVAVSSTNLRSGPGTGYTVLGYGYRDQEFIVGGRNPEDNWLVVATENGGSAWVSRGTVQTQGACTSLTTFNVPLQDAQPAQIIITSPGESSGYSDEGEHEEHEDDEHDDEHDEGDDD